MSLNFENALLLAQEAQKGGNQSLYSNLLLIPILLVVMYFLVIRPQRKEEKKKKEMLNELKKGDQVVTNSGIHGKIVEFKENNEQVVLNLGKDTIVTFNTNVILKKK